MTGQVQRWVDVPEGNFGMSVSYEPRSGWPNDDVKLYASSRAARPLEDLPHLEVVLPQAPPSVPAEQTYGCICSRLFSGNPSNYVADPVNTATGAFSEAFVDAQLPAPGISFELLRSYTSLSAAPGPLGPGWSHAYDVALLIDGDVFTVRSEDGQRMIYLRQPDGTFVGEPGARSRLEAVTGGYRLVTPLAETMTFDEAGLLTGLADRSGQGLGLTYTSGLLTGITDAAGRQVTLTYDANGLLERVDLPGGRWVGYGYTDGLLTSVRDLRGGSATYAYDAAGRLTSMVDALGQTQFVNTYDAATGRVVEQVDAEGGISTFTWDAATQTATMTDAAGGVWTDVYDDNVLVERTDPLGYVTTYYYDDDLNRVAVRDARGLLTRMTYDACGNLLTRRAPDPLSYLESFTYDQWDNVLTATDGRGNTTTHTYDAAGRLETTTDAAGGVTTRTYTSAGLLETVTGPRGGVTAHTYDADGNRVATTSPSGATTTWTYDTVGRRLSETEARGNEPGADPLQFTTAYTYDDADLLATVTDPLGNVTAYTHDAVGNRTAVTDALARTTTYTYDATGRVTAVTEPDGAVTTSTYDAVGNLVSEVTATGAETTYTYDLARRRVNMVGPRGNEAGADPVAYTWTYGHDAAGNVVAVTDPLGQTTTRAYDALDRLVSETDPLGNVSSYTYDASGNRLSATTPLGQTTTWSYDPDDRVATETEARGNEAGADPAEYTTVFSYDAAGNRVAVTDPLGNETATAYDANGNRISVTDPLGNVVAYRYDALQRLVEVEGGDGAVTGYGYDLAGNVASRTDANGHVTSYGHDLDRRLVSVTSPIGQVWSYGYDAAGNRVRTVTPTGNAAGDPAAGSIDVGFDALDRPVTVAYSDGSAPVSYGHDAAGRRAQMTDGQGTTAYTYDAAGQVVEVARAGESLTYAYDARGDVVQRGYPDGSVTTASFDADGRLATLTTPEGAVSYSYDAAGRPVSTVLPAANGHAESRSYDRAGRLVEVANTAGSEALSVFTVVRDAAGNPTEVTTTRQAGVATEHYTYDAAHRLTAVCYDGPCGQAAEEIAYAYDGVGNRLAEVRSAGATTYSYNAADQLLETVTGGVPRAFSYDTDGNVTGAGADSFSYDVAGRVVSAVVAGVAYGYGYDGDGRRVAVSVGGALVSRWVWDAVAALPRLAVEFDDRDRVARRFSYGLGPVGMATARDGLWLHRDALGSVTDVTSETGVGQWRVAYEPFGVARERVRLRNNAPEVPVGFAGEYRDDSGWYHLRARQYDPGVGRLGAVDPRLPAVGEPAVSAYAYAANRPTVLADPSGEVAAEIWDVVRGAGRAAGDMAVGTTALSVNPWVALEALEAQWEQARAMHDAAGGGLTGWRVGANAFNPFYHALVQTDAAVEAGRTGDWEGVGYNGSQAGVTVASLCAGTFGLARGVAARLAAFRGTAGASLTTRVGSLTRATGLRSPSPNLPGLPRTAPRPLGRGSTGRTTPMNLKEQLAMEEAMANPSAGTKLSLTMKDPRWPGSRGWAKTRHTINGIMIHYVRQRLTGKVDDFKFKEQ